MSEDVCIQCGEGGWTLLLTRPRPLGCGEYQICFGCARRIRKEQDERAQEAIRVAERAGA